MRLKLFRAPTVAAAMTQVRAELGADALILSSRRVGGGVEVTAALEDEAPDPACAAPPCAAPPSAAPPSAAPPDAARLDALRWHGAPPALAAALAAGPLDQALATHLRFEPLDFSPGAAPLLLAGPPGAGKTLTAARLATRLVLGGQTPLVICTDGTRAGAAEQLAAFTRVLGLVLIVAPDALTMARALARREAGCPVLIDTAGIDPFSLADHMELAGLAGAAAARCLVVLPAGLDAAEAADTAAAFAAAGATLMAPTRLDIARRLGGILAAAASGLALTEAGVGPGAADGLHPLTPAWLARRLAPPPTRKAA